MQKDCREPLAGGRVGLAPAARPNALHTGRARVGLVILHTVILSAWVSSAGAQTVPPNEAYRTLRTEHFRITFPGSIESLVPDAAASAERAYATLASGLAAPPSGPIDLLLTDHTDLANGSANVFPSNRVTIWVQPSLDGLALSEFDDHLDLVISHELTHIFELDQAGPLGRAVRTVFGRVPWTWPSYTGYTVSPLGVEGVAVWQETLQTGAGRLYGSFFDAIARTQALAGRSESVDQGLGDSPLWPGADRPYVLGSLFFQYLADAYGAQTVARFLDAMARQWVPYRLDAAAVEVFGTSFGELWSAWMGEVEAQADSVRGRPGLTSPDLLTEGGRRALHPAPRPHGTSVVYVRSDGRSDPRIVLLTPEGERTVTRWNSLERPSWLPDGSLLVAQLEFVDTYRSYRDLYRVTTTGDVQRLTRGLRVVQADPDPSGDEIVAVLAGETGNRLVVLSTEGGLLRTLRDEEPGVFWSYPAWSPDGSRMAVARHRPGAWTAILVLDRDGREVASVTEDRSLNTAPAWSPGGDAVIWSSDRSGVPNLYAARFPADSTRSVANRSTGAADPAPASPVFTIRQVTDLATAGSFPAVDSDGRWIYLSVLTGDGWEIGRVPYRPDAWFDPQPIDPRYASGPQPESPGFGPSGASAAGASAYASALQVGSMPYSPLQTMLPRYWLPVRIEPESSLGTRILPTAWGAKTSGYDLVNRHEYDLSVATSLGGGRSRTEWAGTYRWSGLGNPALVLETGQEWAGASPLVVSPSDGGPEVSPDTLLSLTRERWVGGAFELRLRRYRVGALMTAGARLVSQEGRLLDRGGTETEEFHLLRPRSSLVEARWSVALSTARSYAFSVSTEEGVRFSLGLRQRWDRTVPDSLVGVVGGDRAFREGVASISVFHGVSGPGYANHVVALRVAGGIADGPGAGSGHFSVGGGGGDGQGVLGFTLGSAFRRFPVRGVPGGVVRGRRAWSLSAEWRFPIAMVHRGVGSWPVYVDRIAGSLFVDAAGAQLGGESGGEWNGVSSAGAEVVVFHSLLFEAVDRIRLGVAVPLETAPGFSRSASVYLRTGWSF